MGSKRDIEIVGEAGEKAANLLAKAFSFQSMARYSYDTPACKQTECPLRESAKSEGYVNSDLGMKAAIELIDCYEICLKYWHDNDIILKFRSAAPFVAQIGSCCTQSFFESVIAYGDQFVAVMKEHADNLLRQEGKRADDSDSITLQTVKEVLRQNCTTFTFFMDLFELAVCRCGLPPYNDSEDDEQYTTAWMSLVKEVQRAVGKPPEWAEKSIRHVPHHGRLNGQLCKLIKLAKEGTPHAEIGRKLGWAATTVKTRLSELRSEGYLRPSDGVSSDEPISTQLALDGSTATPEHVEEYSK